MTCKQCGAPVFDGGDICAACAAKVNNDMFSRAGDLDFSGNPVNTVDVKHSDTNAAAPEIRINMGGPRKDLGGMYTPVTPPPAPPRPPVQTPPQTPPRPVGRYCAKCGMVMSPNATFCPKCGTPTGTGPRSAPVAPPKRKQSKGGLVAVIIAIALAMAIGVSAFFLFLGRSVESTVGQFVDAMFTGNAKAMMKLIPEDMIEYALDEAGYDEDEYDELLEELEDQFDGTMDIYEDYFGDDWSYSYEIGEIDDLSKKKLRELQENYEDEFDVEVKAAKTVEVEITIEGETDSEATSLELTLIKVGGSWYIDVASIGNLF